MNSAKDFSRLSFVGASYCIAVILAATVFVDTLHADANWPRWRGPRQDGHAKDDVPVRWTAADIVWKTTLPGRGQSSPVIWDNQIFLTSALDRGRERIVFCVDRSSGSILWQTTAWTGEPEPSHVMNGWASSTCATDGEVVVAFFGRGGLHAYTLEGKRLWSLDLGKFESPWSVAACPIIVGDLVIQNGDSDIDAFIAAYDKWSGKQVWRTKRPDNRGWSTPILVQVPATATDKAHDELVLNGHTGVFGYDPKTGKELWFCKGFNGRGEPTVTPAGDVLCVVNGLSGDFYAVRPGGHGDVTATRMAWHTPRKGGRDCPSPIVVGQFVIVCDMKGIATCYRTTDGKELWKERIASNISSSPIAAGGLVYFQSEAGVTIVIRPGPKLDIVAENTLSPSDDEIFRASLTPSQGQIFSRSDQVLYCIGPRKD
ncbi:MAG TPA: PQQ-binding-like beta-propeller repeat protein [Pirellulales bacterium]|nr:PQQ-binding-like beta-propeller repeat protein [Pirellulales bacterium]